MSEGTERLTVTVKWFLPLVFLLCSEPHRQEDSNLTRLMVTTFKLPQTTLKGCNTWSPLTAEKKERCRSQQERLPPPTAALSLQHMLTFLSATAAVTEQVVKKAGNKGETRNTICHCLPTTYSVRSSERELGIEEGLNLKTRLNPKKTWQSETEGRWCHVWITQCQQPVWTSSRRWLDGVNADEWLTVESVRIYVNHGNII